MTTATTTQLRALVRSRNDCYEGVVMARNKRGRTEAQSKQDEAQAELDGALEAYLTSQVERDEQLVKLLRLGAALVRNQYSSFNPHANQFLNDAAAVLARMEGEKS